MTGVATDASGAGAGGTVWCAELRGDDDALRFRIGRSEDRSHFVAEWPGLATLRSDRSPDAPVVLVCRYSPGSFWIIRMTQWRGIFALLIALVALWRKLRHEERWLGEIFGADYAKYRDEVAALIPFVL